MGAVDFLLVLARLVGELFACSVAEPRHFKQKNLTYRSGSNKFFFTNYCTGSNGKVRLALRHLISAATSFWRYPVNLRQKISSIHRQTLDRTNPGHDKPWTV
jgi:hypothetical protein